tara:strand:+ start:387 stop:536 length:150 start_codon:yes stop_codon:yes gene_type:complete
MKKIVLIIAALALTSCTTYMPDISKSIKNIGNNPCYDKETKTVKIACNK